MYTITDFGAVGNGHTINSPAIQRAIDACGAAGGGTVVVPAGIFCVGTIFLRSNVELHLEHGAVLKGSDNLADYNALDAYLQNCECPNEGWNGCHMILAIEVENVAITGSGVIDGSGDMFFGMPRKVDWGGGMIWAKGFAFSKDPVNLRPGQMIVFCECRNVRISRISIRNSPCWCCFFHGCEDVFADGLKIENDPTFANSDGIDIDACRNVIVSNCIINTGDDAITLRGNPHGLKNPERICENITVTNCVVSSTSSVFRIGVGNGIIRNAVFSNIVITGGGIGVHFQSSYNGTGRGVSISNIQLQNISMHNVYYPFMIMPGQPTATAQIENITFDGVVAEVWACASISGNMHSLPRNIQLRNIDFLVMPNPLELDAYPDTFLDIEGVDGLHMNNVHVTWMCGAPHWTHAISVSEIARDVQIAPNCRLSDPPADKSYALV